MGQTDYRLSGLVLFIRLLLLLTSQRILQGLGLLLHLFILLRVPMVLIPA